MTDILELIYNVFSSCISVLMNFTLVAGVSMFSFLICITLISIVIRYIVPSAKAPSIHKTNSKGKLDNE